MHSKHLFQVPTSQVRYQLALSNPFDARVDWYEYLFQCHSRRLNVKAEVPVFPS